MGGHERTEQTLALLGRRGAYEALSVMHAGGGVATYAQIAAEAPRLTAILRALVAEGFVANVHGGTLDHDPPAETRFALTAEGQAIFSRLVWLQQWATSRATSTQERPGRSTYTENA